MIIWDTCTKSVIKDEAIGRIQAFVEEVGEERYWQDGTVAIPLREF